MPLRGAQSTSGNGVVVVTPSSPRVAEAGLSGIAPLDVVLVGWGNRKLLATMVRRDIESRYKGTAIGLFWLVAVPLVMLAAYAAVFTGIFGIRFPYSPGKLDTTLGIYAGIIIVGFFAEAVGRAPALLPDMAILVKRVVFPLRIIPLMAVATSGAGLVVSMTLLVAARAATAPALNPAWLAAPAVILPAALATCGAAWLLAALGAFVRDLKQITTVCLTLTTFATPVFYPSSAVPESWRWAIQANPLTYPVESLRALLFEGRLPDAGGYLLHTAACWLLATLGYLAFSHTQKWFADVV